MSANESGSNVLITGDFIIDRTWVVTDLPLPKRYESHYDVVPSTLAKPDNRTDVAGGVGTIARAIIARSEIGIRVVTGWSDDVRPEELVPIDGMTDLSRVEFLRAATARFTTLKLRVFTSEPAGPILRSRYDRNLVPADLKPLDVEWPSASAIDVVIVSDYDFGFLTNPKLNIISKLQDYAGKPMILRSPNTEVITALPWTLLAINIRHLTTILDYEQPFDKPLMRHVHDGVIFHPEFITALNRARTQLEIGDRVLLVRIERNFAALLSGDRLIAVSLAIAHNEPDGVGSGDVVLANTALSYIRGDNLIDSATNGFVSSAIFNGGARRLDAIDGWYASKCDLKQGDKSVSVISTPEQSLDRVTREQKDARVYEDLIDGCIQLRNAEWYLKDFLTVQPEFGAKIVALKRQMKAFVDNNRGNGSSARPFLAVLCGEPGAGKSTLASALAEAVGCEVLTESAAQWVAPEDLFWLCERIRSVHMRKQLPLAFIDEVDAKVASERLYGKLLSPVWDGAYFIRGEERKLGATIFLLAGSTPQWRTSEALLKASTDPAANAADKLPDLISRLTAAPLEIPALKDRRADVVYMAAHRFLKQFPAVRKIAKGVLRLLAESKCQHGSRSITRVVEMFGPLASDDRVMPTDLRGSRRAEMKLHIPDPVAGWESDTRLVSVEI